jgi:carbohydrate diacid regulator
LEYLNKQLAQEIVDRTMGIIGRNINVMDHNGIIIGSGDKKRIDDIHGGAVIVLERGEGFTISEEEAKRFHGVKAGVNLPITFNGKIVGVIGITGNPEEILNFGELVRMAAELSLQQAVLINEIQWDERLKEELVSQIIHFDGQLDSLFYERSKRMDIDFELSRTAIILFTTDSKKTFEFLKDRLEKADLSLVQHDRIIILKNIPPGNRSQAVNYAKQMADSWIKGLKETKGINIKASIGDFHDGLTGIARSYRQAAEALNAGLKLSPDSSIYTYNEFHLPVFLLASAKAGLTGDLESLSKTFTDKDPKGELIETLLTFIGFNGDMNAAARQLYIHRNTLRYRLDKITDITGKDPRKTTELFHLYIAIVYNQLK